jgi:hypothetical protein
MNEFDELADTNAFFDGPRASSPAWNVLVAPMVVRLREAFASLRQMHPG